jgi:hypothetical protein
MLVLLPASTVAVALALSAGPARPDTTSLATCSANSMKAVIAGRSLCPEARRPAIGNCTLAAATGTATVEVEIANAADFCELVSKILAGPVFHEPVLVTPGLWHNPNSTLSCRLQYLNTPYRLAVYDSRDACRWLSKLAPGWHFLPAPTPSQKGLA